MTINFAPSEDINEERAMHSQSANMKIMINDEADEVTEELFESPFSRYNIGLEDSMKGSDFMFDYLDLLLYRCHRMNPNHVDHM